ncbi:hypothetical protein Bca101_035338 [Brassica carinata]
MTDGYETAAIRRLRGIGSLGISSAVDATGNPIPTSAVLTASAKHIGLRCMPENVAFLKCKKSDPNPEKCLDKGRDVTRCVLCFHWLTDLHQKCQKEMDDYQWRM